MGISKSKQKAILKQGEQIKNNLYLRANTFKKNYQNQFDSITTQLKKKILQASALQIADFIDNQQITTLQTLYIFIERTITFGIQNNYVFDQLFEEAVVEAFNCDQQRKRDEGKKRCWRPGMNAAESYPPFYGVPSSIKQTLVMKGRQIHAGFIKKVNPLSENDGLFVMMIRKMGFIPFIRSNVPQACKALQTNNNIFGYSQNPWNKNRGCGGSSGGQSGLVASYCSPIGFGSDLGGSLRIPAAFTGLVTLKMFNRYSRLGNCYYGKYISGFPLKSELGPITRTVQDLIMVHQYLYNSENYNDIEAQFLDPYMKLIPFDWSTVNSPHKYKIGVLNRLSTAKSSKANERAVDITKELLEKKGHQLINIDIEELQKLYFFFGHLFTFDQKLLLLSQFQGQEPLTVQYKLINLVRKIPWFLRKLITLALKNRQSRLAKMIDLSKPETAISIFEQIGEIYSTVCPKINQMFVKNKLDALILPSFVTPAPPHGQTGKLQYFFAFSSAWNVLNFPAGVLPITVVKQGQTSFQDQYNDYYTTNVNNSLAGSEGMPVGVQFVSTPYNEEKILYLMREIEQQVKFRVNYHIPQ